MITDELLREIVQRIVDAFDPEAIILFGSRAYGEPDADSDVDLLVIADTLAHRSVFERHRAISDLFPRRRFSLDVLVRTPEELRELLEHGPSFFREITARGKVLYERRSYRMGSEG
jgi:predicted nucleotidyltransferase